MKASGKSAIVSFACSFLATFLSLRISAYVPRTEDRVPSTEKNTYMFTPPFASLGI